MLELKSNAVLALEQGIVLHSLPDQDWYHAFNVRTGDQFQLNKTSFWVVEKISTGVEWLSLRDDFLYTFEVTSEQGEADLQDLVSDLYTQKIIRREAE